MSTCEHCHKETDHGGIYSRGDGYGDGQLVGLGPWPWTFTCWDCKDFAPDHNNEIDKAFADRGLCGFLEAYVGRCRESKPCAKHANQTCWKCGKPAVRNCDETFTLVCGTPECAEHSHYEYHRRSLSGR